VKGLFDTNVVLDHLLGREPFVDAAEQLLSLVDSGRIDGVICSTVTVYPLSADGTEWVS
jgi:predicted nucleic acid-binding protein